MPKRRRRYKWDAFISYASDDAEFVNSLHDTLHDNYGLKVWLDKLSMRVGRGLRQAVDEGLRKSRFGIVVFSPKFFEKKFPQAELDALFSRQMNGRDVILPVWHGVDAEQVRENAATLADKWAAKSSDGVARVAQQIVQVIKPKALKLETGRADAQRANTRLLRQLEQHNPTLRFGLSVGPAISPDKPFGTDRAVPGAVGSISFSGMRIDIFPRDPEQYAKNPVTYGFRLLGEGVEKFKEAIRSGLPQEFKTGEFENVKTSLNIGLPPGAEAGGRLFLQPSVPPHKGVPVRVRLGSGNDAVTLPYMEIRQERAGTQQASFIARTRDGLFTLRSVVGLKPHSEGTIQTNTRVEHAEVHDLQKYNRATAALQQTGEVEITSLERETPLLKVKCSVEKPTKKNAMFRQFVDDLVRVSDYFGIRLIWPDQVGEADLNSLGLLLTAIDGKPVGTGATFSGIIVKSPQTQQAFETMKNGGHMAIVQEEPFTFFGTQIEAGTLAYCVENVHIRDFEAIRQKFESAANGDIIEVTYETKSPVILRRWDKSRCRFADD